MAMTGHILSYSVLFKQLKFKCSLSLNHLRCSLNNPTIRTLRSEANIISCKEQLANVDGQTIPEILRSNLHKWENDKAIVSQYWRLDCAETGRVYTHGEIYKKSRSFATALKQSGLKRNDIVGIVLPNIPEYPIVYIGIWDAGLIASPTNLNYLPDEIGKQMLLSGAKAIVTIPALVSAVKLIQKSCPKIKSIIVIGDTTEDCHSFYEMVKVDSTGKEFLKGTQITDDDVALIPFSSGTTGPPKGVMLTHKSVGINILQLCSPDFHSPGFNKGGSSQERLVALLPFFHIYGANVILGTALYQGNFITCVPSFNPKSFIETIKKHKPTFMHLAPPLVAFLNQSSDIGRKDTKYLKAVVFGAAPAGLTLINSFLKKFGDGIFFQEGYGLTECSPATHICRQSYHNTKLGSIGCVLPGTLSKVVDINTGKALGPNEEGEICVKGPQIMKGYLNNEKATKEILDPEGWIHTGDIGYYDKDEYFFIVDRIKELIKVKGLQVAPAELEDILRKHPAIRDVAVIGVPHERAGEAPRAYIVKNSDVSVKEITDYLHKQVARHKYLIGGVEFIDSIPKAASGKILRRELKAEYTKRHK